MECNFSFEFNDYELDEFLINFDAIKLKYDIDKDSSLYDRAMMHEQTFRTSDYTKKDTASFIENTNLVYDDNEEESMKFLWRYKNSVDKLLNRYVSVFGLSRLFDERYIEFEWDMHSRMDFNNHSISYYRDHFIHQLRDCFMLIKLLDNSQIYNRVLNIMKDRTKSKVSRFFHEHIEKLLYNVDNNTKFYSLLQDLYEEKYLAENDEEIAFSEYVEEYYSRYIIYSSAIIASLFHDIGYPIVHYFGYQKRLLKFAPSVYMLINGDKSSNEKIAALLSQSLLFQVVGKEEILYCGDENHGAFSAIALLLHFYETGMIYSLPLEQKVAVELAALAIYNHTNQYQFIKAPGKKPKYNYYRAQFNLNPISFLLRLCDDAQEWERTYFEISNTPTLLYCKKCYTPLKRIKRKKDEVYYCKCGCNSNDDTCFRLRDTEFDRRVIYNVIPSKSLVVHDNNRGNLFFDFDYDYFKLLRMCSISPTYAQQRTKELNYIKSLVIDQNIGYKKGILISFFMSNNPILIKSFIIQNAMKKMNLDIGSVVEESIIESDYSQFQSACKVYYESDFNSIFNSINNKFKDLELNNPLLNNEWCKKHVMFYLLINAIGKCVASSEKIKSNKIDELSLKTDRIALMLYQVYIDFNGTPNDLILKLLKDTIIQYAKMGDINNEDYFKSTFYKESMKSNESLIFDVNCYCNVENELNSDESSGEFSLDYYSDLYLFECLNSIIVSKDIGKTANNSN